MPPPPPVPRSLLACVCQVTDILIKYIHYKLGIILRTHKFISLPVKQIQENMRGQRGTLRALIVICHRH